MLNGHLRRESPESCSRVKPGRLRALLDYQRDDLVAQAAVADASPAGHSTEDRTIRDPAGLEPRPGAVHALRGMLEFYAAPTYEDHRPEIDPNRRTILY